MPKMAPGDDIEAFLEVFERTAEACGWPPAQWAVSLLPLLMADGLSTVQWEDGTRPFAMAHQMMEAAGRSRQLLDEGSARASSWLYPRQQPSR